MSNKVNTPTIVLNGNGYALVPIASMVDAERLHAAGVTIRLEAVGVKEGAYDSTHLDPLCVFKRDADWFTSTICPLDSTGQRTAPLLFAIFRP